MILPLTKCSLAPIFDRSECHSFIHLVNLSLLYVSVPVSDVIWCEMDSSFIVAFSDGVTYLANKECVIMAFDKQLVRSYIMFMCHTLSIVR